MTERAPRVFQGREQRVAATEPLIFLRSTGKGRGPTMCRRVWMASEPVLSARQSMSLFYVEN